VSWSFFLGRGCPGLVPYDNSFFLLDRSRIQLTLGSACWRITYLFFPDTLIVSTLSCIEGVNSFWRGTIASQAVETRYYSEPLADFTRTGSSYVRGGYLDLNSIV